MPVEFAGAFPPLPYSADMLDEEWNAWRRRVWDIAERFEGKRVFVSDEPFRGFREVAQVPKLRPKPQGLWYGCGAAWIEWAASEMPERLGGYLYEVGVDLSRMCLIRTEAELDAFTEAFGGEAWRREDKDDDNIGIDWAQVAARFSGIEICPYIRSRRRLTWYSGWSVASGCVWDSRAFVRATPLRTPDIVTAETQMIRNPGQRTFAKARADIFAHLTELGWRVQLRDTRTGKPLKTPYAVDPSGEHRLNFKPQAVYLGERSIHVDVRDLTPAEFMEYVARWTRLEPNALLRRPPEARHRLRAQTHGYFERVVGRAPNSSDYDGVHTTGDRALAAAYAMGTWDQVGGADGEAYPVILALDVSGLSPEPDVDAMLTGLQALKDIRSEVANILEMGDGPDGIRWAGEHYDVTRESGAGDDPAAFVFEEIPRDPFRSLIEALERQGMDDDQMDAVLRQFVKDGADVLPGIVISKIVDQQRYLNDFDLDRVVQIVAFKPWWPEVMDAYWDMDDEQETAKAESIEAGGWKLWTIEDAFQIEPEPYVVLYQRDEAQTAMPFFGEPRVEYHGTVSTVVFEAFGDIIPKDPPFPVDPEG